MISYLESKGYKIQRPPKEIKDEYTFENAWNLYQKKVGDKDKLKKKWNSMSLKDRKAATEYIPIYVVSKPDKQFRLNFQTFLNQKRWNDEIIGATPPPAITNEQDSSIGKLIQDTRAAITKQQDGSKLEEERKRIQGMIDIVNANPRSSARKSLEFYYLNGRLNELGLVWHP